MIITREIGGMVHQFELTEKELEAAYREREDHYDEQDVLLFLNNVDGGELFADIYGMSVDKVKQNAKEIGVRKRCIEDDNGGMPWYEAVEEAIRDFAMEKEES